MANICYTNCIITGPEAEIERFKQTCFFTPPKPDGGNGIDFTRAEWKAADVTIWWSNYRATDGKQELSIRSAPAGPIITSLEKISALFPELTFGDLTTGDEFYNFFYRGSIKAGVADLHKDEEAMRKFQDAMYA